MSERQWSVVLTEFAGGWKQWRALDEAAPRIFGRSGLDAFSLACGRDTLPAEVADTLARDEAVWVAEALQGLGGMVFAASPLNARHNLAVLRGVHQAEWEGWQYERGMNHVHADASRTELTPRERVRAELELAAAY